MNKTPKYILLSLCLFIAFGALAQGKFVWTPELIQAYQLTTSLRFEKAQKLLAETKLNDPDNLMRLHVENYLDFFRVYINEDESEFEKLEKNKNDRLDQIEKEGDPTSPYYLFLQADIRLQWALARLKFEEYATAFFETNKAFKLLTENDEQFPDFLPNKKDLGILHAMVGTIPDNYKWAIDIFSSMNGTLEQGRGELEEVIKKAEAIDFVYETEIYVYYAYLLLHLGNDAKEAWNIIKTSSLHPEKDPIACFIVANVAMRSDHGDEAIEILTNRPNGLDFHPFYYLDYMLGIAKLQRLDEDAGHYLERFVSYFKGKNFIKDAYQKLAWFHLINGDLKLYEKNISNCISEGYKVVGSDQSAYNEAKSKLKPNAILIKARLLTDGGRYDQALDLLKDKRESDFYSKRDKIEFYYRKGRILHATKKYDDAISYYRLTIEKGKDEPWYFACRAALEQGHIYEILARKEAAIAAFELCLDISPADHKSGLHQQAKAGLLRLKN